MSEILSKNNLRCGDSLTVTIENLAFEGPGIARINSYNDANEHALQFVIFVDGTAPGDIVEIEIFSKRKGFAKGRVKRFLKYSPFRVKSSCPHFGLPQNISGEIVDFSNDTNCGGCSWRFLDYEKQLKIKDELVKDALIRIGGVDPYYLKKILKPIVLSDSPNYYRNKMDFSFSYEKTGKIRLGLHVKGRFHDIAEVKSCELFRPWIGGFLDVMRNFWNTQCFKTGKLLSLVVRAGHNTGEIMVNLIAENFVYHQDEIIKQFAAKTVEFFNSKSFLNLSNSAFYLSDHLVSIFYTNVYNKKGQTKKFEENLLWGVPVFREILNIGSQKLNFEIAPGAFLQPNTKQAERIYKTIVDLAELKGGERVFDLFCGTGTIGICLAAASAGLVTGIELNLQAVENAIRNAKFNNIENIEFLVGDATKLLPELGKSVDLIIVDPPRSGMTEKIIDTIASTSVKKLIYVSCNPPTLARDIKLLSVRNFKLDFVQPIDQFSHTYHVECICVMTKI